MRTGRAAAPTATPGVGLAFSPAASRPSARRVDTPRITASASTSNTVGRLLLATMRTMRTMIDATAEVAPATLRTPVRVTAYEAAALQTMRHAAPATGRS